MAGGDRYRRRYPNFLRFEHQCSFPGPFRGLEPRSGIGAHRGTGNLARWRPQHRKSFEVTEETLREVFDQLAQQKVLLEGMLLKPSMVISGGSAAQRADPAEVAERTIECFKRVLPASVPGVVFLSGGEPDNSVTANLNAINQKTIELGMPWQLTFSFGRSLQGAPLSAWAGKAENTEAAALAFYTRARLTSAARQGKYIPED